MYTYALRTKQSNWNTLIALGKTLGVIQEVDGQIVATYPWAWVYIGTIADPLTWEDYTNSDGETVKINQTPLGVDWEPYIHANLRTTINIRERAEQLATENPLIAWALSRIPEFFITDEFGNATLPKNPVNVFA